MANHARQIIVEIVWITEVLHIRIRMKKLSTIDWFISLNSGHPSGPMRLLRIEFLGHVAREESSI